MYFVGLDLGQRQDFTAVAVVERTTSELLARRIEGWLPGRLCTVEREEGVGFALVVLHLERMPLGTPYTKVVQRVCELMGHPKLKQQSRLVVDATGVGAPVVELLRSAGLGARVTAVTITGGERAHGLSQGGGEHWHVPKKDLLAGLEVLLEAGNLKISRRLKEAGRLARELTSMRLAAGEGGRWRAEDGGEHDDLAMAVGLACWRARAERSEGGRKRLPGI